MYYPINSYNNISSYYGHRKFLGKDNFHNGVDFPAIEGKEVYAANYGTVIFAGFNNFGYGNHIIILHNNGLKSLYGHLDENFIVKLGQRIKAHQLIGYVGPKILSNGISNGNTTGCHLHFSIFDVNGKTIDPLTLNLKKADD